jgi:hypothetical protein
VAAADVGVVTVISGGKQNAGLKDWFQTGGLS